MLGLVLAARRRVLIGRLRRDRVVSVPSRTSRQRWSRPARLSPRKSLSPTRQRAELRSRQRSSEARGAELTVQHGALVYDKKGLPWVFAVIGPLTYVRSAVTVKQVDGDVVTLSSGPPAGTEVVTVGAIELWGTELGIAGKH